MNSPYKGKFKVTSIQGTRILNGKTSNHNGLDLVGEDKNLYSTVNGTVEIASNADPNGFGWYVRIRESSTGDKYYYGHMTANSIVVKVNQVVKVGDLLGKEGSTGSSTGSHCHYEARRNSVSMNISQISGIPNAIGIYESTSNIPKNPYLEPKTNLKTGSNGEGVYWVQWELNRRGNNLAPDGLFGAKTQKAVMDFQSSQRIIVDGIVGAVTRERLKL